MFEHEDKFPRKNIFEENIGFGLQIWIMLHFTGFGLEMCWTVIYNRT